MFTCVRDVCLDKSANLVTSDTSDLERTRTKINRQIVFNKFFNFLSVLDVTVPRAYPVKRESLGELLRSGETQRAPFALVVVIGNLLNSFHIAHAASLLIFSHK